MGNKWTRPLYSNGKKYFPAVTGKVVVGKLQRI
jgi:hypothetical protein